VNNNNRQNKTINWDIGRNVKPSLKSYK